MARRVSSPILIGRRAELDRLTGALAEAAAGRATTFLMGGEAGIGKTRLVSEFGRIATGAGARLLSGACIPVGEAGLPYGPFVEALRRLLAMLDATDGDPLSAPVRSALARLLPDLADGSLRGPSSGVAWQRERQFELLLGLLGRLSSAAPVVLVVEDLHWADRETLDLLTFLTFNLRDERVMIVATYRSDEVERHHPLVPFLAEIDRSGRSERLDLDRFDEAELGDLIGAILGRAPDPLLVDSIRARSGGNAYYAEELVALGAAATPLPRTLREVLLARIDGLAEPTRELLKVASAARAGIDADLLGRVGGVGPAELSDGLREAVARHVLLPLDGGDERYGFRHDLMGEAVYGELLPHERMQLHADLARALAPAVDPDRDPLAVAELAHHWAMARDLPRALATSVQAGLAARRACAFAVAEVQLERAIELWPQVPEAAGLAEMDLPALLELAAEAAAAAGASVRTVAHLRAALRLVDADSDPVRAGLLYDRLGDAEWIGGEPTVAFAAHREAVRLVPGDPPSVPRATVLEGLARSLVLYAKGSEGAALAREAITIARALGARDVEADALATLGAAERAIGDADSAAETLRAGRDLALEIGALDAAARAWNNLASLLEGEASATEALAAADWAGAHGLGRSIGRWTLCIAALALLELGRWDEADSVLQRVGTLVPGAAAERFAELCRAASDIGRGRHEVAAARLAGVRHLSGPPSGDELELIRSHLEAQLDLERRELAEARAAMERGLAALADLPPGVVATHCRMLSTALRIEADLGAVARLRRRSGALAECQRRGDTILDRARSHADTVAEGRATLWRRPGAVLATCEAERSRLQGNSRPDLWREAADACAAAGQSHLRPYALFRQAEAILSGTRGRQAATPVLREALRIAAAMGAVPLCSEIEALALRARIELETTEPTAAAAAAPAPFDRVGLTRREREVLDLVAAGQTNRQIAETLFITERTVGVHVSNILGKLGASSRTEAAAMAHRLGLTGR